MLVKKRGESIEHVLMKAALWALYLPEYHEMQVEVPIGDTFKPDLVQLAPPPGGLAYGAEEPIFWGEAGKVSRQKWAPLLRRFPDTHVALARWDERLGPTEALVRTALGSRPRRAPVDLVSLPPDAARYVSADGSAGLAGADVERVRLWG